MGLYKRGRIWWVSYQLSGNRQARESSHSTNKRVAQNLLLRRRLEVFDGQWAFPVSKTPRLDEWAQRFLPTVAHNNTRERYEVSVKNLVEFFGSVKLSQIAPAAIYAFQQARLAKGLSPATVNRDRAVLSRMLNLARKHQLIATNPCSLVEPLNERRTRRQAIPFSYQEEERIKTVSNGWFRMLFILLVETGLRVKKEALPLKWSDVDLASEPVRMLVKDSKSAAGVRPVYLTSYCRQELLKWQEQYGADFSPYIFPSPQNPQRHIADYKKQWAQMATLAGVTGRRLYDTRCTFASRVNACGHSILTVAQMMGHAGTAILPAYVKPLDENTRAVLAALDRTRKERATVPSLIH